MKEWIYTIGAVAVFGLGDWLAEKGAAVITWFCGG